jgi:hypothetical protein
VKLRSQIQNPFCDTGQRLASTLRCPVFAYSFDLRGFDVPTVLRYVLLFDSLIIISVVSKYCVNSSEYFVEKRSRAGSNSKDSRFR